jgi:hypothetical protein|nr:hypothetical protein [Kofleriaceae bacterium]
MGFRSLGLTVLALAACGGGSNKKPDTTPDQPAPLKKPPPPPETEADREAKRHAFATSLVPDGSTCLPAALKDNGAPVLDIAAVDSDAIVCATDVDPARLAGPIACWKVTLRDGSLAYQTPAPLPGHDVDVKLDGSCARGYCLPAGDAVPDDKIAHMAWSLDGTKVAVLAGDQIDIFDGASKDSQAKFSIRGDKGVVGPASSVAFMGDYLIVESKDPPGAYVFKSDGTPSGPITAIGAKDQTPISTAKGSLLLLDKDKVAVAEQGFSTVTEFDLATGKRTKLVRKVAKPACKPDELEQYWKDGDKVSDKCRDSMAKAYEPYIGATGLAGKKSLLIALRGPRLGELGVLDPKTLAEKSAIKLPWCDAAGAGSGAK